MDQTVVGDTTGRNWAGQGSIIMRALAIGSLAGLAAGVLVGGIGGRVAMRLVVLATSRMPAQSTGGTLSITVVGAFLGVTLGVAYVALRRWLPRGWLVGGLTYGLGLLALLGTTFFVDGLAHADSELREGPVGLGIALFSVLFVGFGPIVAAIFAGLNRWLPQPQRGRVLALVVFSAIGFVGLLVALLGGALVVLQILSTVVTMVTGSRLSLPPF